MPWFSSTGRCLSGVKLIGKTAIVTGCNTGIGKETVLNFYKRGARVVMACRSIEKAEEAKKDIETTCSNLPDIGKLVVVKCDLNSLNSVRECAQNILDTEPEINILVNNAGVMMCPKGLTEDGFEIQFGTNHLAHFLLTLMLLPRIRNSKPARIVTVSSRAHIKYNIDLEDPNYKKRTYYPGEAYGQSMNLLPKPMDQVLLRPKTGRARGTCLSPLSRSYRENNIEGVNTYSLHPGVIKTELGRHLNDSLFWGARVIIGLMFAPFYKSTEQGAQTSIFCSVDEKCANETGLYYSDCAAVNPAQQALNDENAKKLWDLSVEMVGLKDYNPFTANDPGINIKNV